ncbi:MAG: hypothetical protein ACE5JR_05655 [Gemmatimonadota bacterium]
MRTCHPARAAQPAWRVTNLTCLALALLWTACTLPDRSGDTEYEPAGEKPQGTELVAVYIGSSTCAPCQTPELKAAIRQMKDELSRRAEGEGRRFYAIGVALDWSIEDGMELLRSTATFDEILVGRNWLNTGAIEHIWSDPGTRQLIPQVIVFEREVRWGSQEIELGPKRVLRRVGGGGEISEWVEAGAPLSADPAPAGGA